MTSRASGPPRVLGVLVLALLEVGGTIGASQHQQASRGLDVLAILLVLAAALALLGLRCRPIAALVLVTVLTLAYLARGYAYGPIVVNPAIAVFVVLVRGHRLAAWIAFAALYAGHVAVRSTVLDRSVSFGQLLGVAAWGLVILFCGEMIRIRRERLQASVAVRRERRKRQVNEERLRIAQELHDVVAHHMSLINVQAGVALHLVDRRPDQVQTALAVIKDASKEALVELRSLVGVLRDEADPAPRAPVAMLDSLDDLVERSALAGLTIRRRIVGDVVRLPAAVELAAFRIIQESVTNVIRHAEAQHAEILLEYRSDELVVQVEDDGSGWRGGVSSAEGAGSGLRGMQERAVALRGSMTRGVAASGGVQIRAYLPLAGTP